MKRKWKKNLEKERKKWPKGKENREKNKRKKEKTVIKKRKKKKKDKKEMWWEKEKVDKEIRKVKRSDICVLIFWKNFFVLIKSKNVPWRMKN